MTLENEKEPRRKKADAEENKDPVHVVRMGGVAASIWQRQSPSGYPYYDFSLSRSWKSSASGKTGYSKNFFSRNRDELLQVVEQATAWIAEREETAQAENALAA